MKNCTQCKSSFEIIAPRFYEKLELPHPTLCPICRRQRRLAFWPFGILQKRKCDFSGEPIVSTYSVDSRFPVYKREHWLSDKWEAPEMEIDWDRSFFDQLFELQTKTPHFHQQGTNNVNCDYTDDVWDCKNSYLSRSMLNCEDIYYSYRVINCKDSLDLTYCYDMEQSYECTYCFKGYQVMYSMYSNDCSNSWFLYDCRGCRNCFMCWNLRNREYCIFNKQYTKEEYEEKINSLHLNSRKFTTELKRRFEEHVKNDAIHRPNHNINVQNCTGNYLTNCKDCKNMYFIENSENCAFGYRSPKAKNCMDLTGLLNGELCYEVCQSTNLFNVHFSFFCVDCSDSYYLDQCFNCSNCFGCVGLKRKKYCILNKQYKKDEYEALVKKLISKMKEDKEFGEFLPYKFAYNGFNLSLGNFFYSETEESMKEKGGFFENISENHSTGENASRLTDLSESFTDDLLGKPFICAQSGQPFTFIKQEFDFYRKFNLPLPIIHPEERNKARFNKLAPPIPRKTTCKGCKKKYITFYPEEWGYKRIGCEDCFLKTVY